MGDTRTIIETAAREAMASPHSKGDIADAVLDALAKAGMVVVSIEPTMKMKRQGAAAMWPFIRDGLAGYNQASAIFAAMLTAAKGHGQ